MISERIYFYPNRTDVSLTTYLWDESAELCPGSRPAILICPGGGYMSCSDREGEPVALRFAAMGYNAFVLRYSTYFKGENGFAHMGEPFVPRPEVAHPAPVLEIGKAMLLIREHADRWHVDAERIAVCGFSAGGHNAAMYATNWHRDIISARLGVDKELLRPAAAILGYPLTDYIYMNEHPGDNAFLREFFRNSNIGFLGTAEPSEEALLSVSPARLVDENTPPMFIWTTAADEMVPTVHSLLLAMALSEHAIPYTLHVFETGSHGLSTGTQASAQALSQVSVDVGNWTEMADVWLKKRFALPLPELTELERMLAGDQPSLRG